MCTRASRPRASRCHSGPEAGHSGPEAGHSGPETGHSVPEAGRTEADRAVDSPAERRPSAIPALRGRDAGAARAGRDGALG